MRRAVWNRETVTPTVIFKAVFWFLGENLPGTVFDIGTRTISEVLISFFATGSITSRCLTELFDSLMPFLIASEKA
jgi:hypothetical protein